MIAALSFDPSHAPEFFTVTDHRIAFRKSGKATHEHAPESLLQETRELIREFLQLPDTQVVQFHQNEPFAINTIGEDSVKAPHADLINWTFHLPYYSITSADIQFSTQYGFGIPEGPSVLIGNISNHPATLMAPPLHSGIFLLNGVICDLLRRGREIIRRETEYKSAVLEGMLDRHPLLQPMVTDAGHRNKMLTAINAGLHADRLAEHLNKAGIGYGRQFHTFFLANTPSQSKEAVEWLADQFESFR